jgi:hypothetical protein
MSNQEMPDPRNIHGYENLRELLGEELGQALYDSVAEVATLTARVKELKELEEKYYDLIYAVQTKFPDESRHDTALRYIRAAEAPKTQEAQDE